MAVFFGAIGLILVVISIPTMAMYACGDFVGQKPPSTLIKKTMMIVIGAGLLFGVVATCLSLRTGGMTSAEWVQLAWVAGASIGAQVALLERLGSSGKNKGPERPHD